MSLSPEAGERLVAGLLALAAAVAPAALDAMRGETVGEILDRGRAHLPPAGASRKDIEEIFAAPALSAAARFSVMDSDIAQLEKLVSTPSLALSHEQRAAVTTAVRLSRAALRGEIVIARDRAR